MPHAETYTEFTPDQYPPFPSSPDFPTIDLQTISLAKLQSNDATEQQRVLDACKTWGFFYLELPNSTQGEKLAADADAICRVAEKTFALPTEEKDRYAYEKRSDRSLFGYKRVGQTLTDVNATPDTAEFFNVGKNDMIAEDEGKMEQEWPGVILEKKDLFKEYCMTAHSVGLQILGVLADKLGIERGEIEKRHVLEAKAGDHVRMTRGPPRKTLEMPEIQTPSHTDFGTITILMNWLGGLQVYGSPNRILGNLSYDDASAEGSWLWVKPKRNCAIINLGDAAVKFTNGVLCSGRHRVVPSPGEQGRWPRYSIVYFVRPIDECQMKTLEGSGIPAAEEEEGEGVNAKDWIFQQATKLRGIKV